MPDSFNLLVGKTFVIRRNYIHDDCAGAKSGAFGGFGGHWADNSGYHHLKAAAGRRCGDINICAFTAVGRRNELAVGIKKLTSGQFFKFGHGIQYTHCNVFKWGFNCRWSFTARYQPVFTVGIFNQNCFGSSWAAVGSDNYLNIFWFIKFCH